MASQVSQILASPISCNMENRPQADFHPGIWGDVFLNCPDQQDIDTTTQLRYEELKEEVRRMLVAPMDTSIQKLPLINAVQRLGVNYHFEKEIEDALEAIYHDNNEADNDLRTTSLRFRLLRVHALMFHVAFYKFKDKEGNFKSSLTNDVQGLLELYEASYMRVHGEDILDEAIYFTTTHLTLAAATLDYPLSEQVTHALKQSIRRGLPRVEARRYISIYQDIESHNKALLEFAKIDFNLLQLLHKKELSEICRVVEGYFWIMGVYFEPQYSLGRKMMTKMIRLAQAYLLEAKWTHQNDKPTFEDFRDNALPTSGYAMLAITTFVGMGDVITPETFTWVAGDPKIIKASTIIYRFMDDIAEHKFKHRREDDCSAIECYIEQYGVTTQEAYDEFNKHIESSWKEINNYFCLHNTVDYQNI
ncbi:hypothetical protein J1N35_004185 [Gossypium stocksii]|uniref:(+)-delta-cadinene synthase n=1 Tax=Gossypium stocksii TaxID=47602 RepID=A0A9D4AI04_9ROSI|nr:hypothetical protein J1N35_004185 [Gossypium stocksii]